MKDHGYIDEDNLLYGDIRKAVNEYFDFLFGEEFTTLPDDVEYVEQAIAIYKNKMKSFFSMYVDSIGDFYLATIAKSAEIGKEEDDAWDIMRTNA